MREFFMAGGFPMWFILVFGLVAVASAARFAWAPGEGRLPALVAQAIAVLCASACGVATDLITVSVHVPQNPELAQSPELPLILLVGFGESLTPAVLGLSFVAVQALLTALGLRRLQPA